MLWEGEDFPHRLHSDSAVFFITGHVYLDLDADYKKDLAKQIRLEGLTDSLSEAFRSIDDGYVSHGGYYFSDEESRFPIYCDLDDDLYDWDATFVEVPFVY